MLKKEFRLKTGRLNNPTQIEASFFKLKVSDNGLTNSRFAFIVSKKIDRRATMRNLLKRKVRSGIEEMFEKIVPGKDFLFYPKKEAALIQREALLKEMTKILDKSNLIK